MDSQACSTPHIQFNYRQHKWSVTEDPTWLAQSRDPGCAIQHGWPRMHCPTYTTRPLWPNMGGQAWRTEYEWPGPDCLACTAGYGRPRMVSQTFCKILRQIGPDFSNHFNETVFSLKDFNWCH